MVKVNRAKEKLRAGGAVFSIIINFLHAGFAEHLARMGFDIIIIDGEHGQADDNEIEEFARACDVGGATPIVRVRPDDSTMQRILALGAFGFHVPNVTGVAEVREVIAAVKFPPSGNRGLGNSRASNYGASFEGWPEHMRKANEQTFIKLAVEDVRGLAELPQMVALPEVDVVQLGLIDLSASMGVPGQTDHPRVLEALDKSIDIIAKAGKTHGMLVGSPADIRRGYERGTRYFLTSASRMLVGGAQDFFRELADLEASRSDRLLSAQRG